MALISGKKVESTNYFGDFFTSALTISILYFLFRRDVTSREAGGGVSGAPWRPRC